MSGWLKLHRQLKDWEWYDDINTSRLFIHCLIRANFKDTKWKGQAVLKGSFITSLDTLKQETSLTISQLRTAFRKLESTGEIEMRSQARSRTVTVVKYDMYQSGDKLSEDEINMKSQGSEDEIATGKELKNLRTKEVNKNTAAPLNIFSVEVFQKWWVHLPSKRKVDKKKSERLWLAATKNKSNDEVRLMANGICDYIEEKTGEDGKGEFMKHPERFIKSEVWNMYQQQESD